MNCGYVGLGSDILWPRVGGFGLVLVCPKEWEITVSPHKHRETNVCVC